MSEQNKKDISKLGEFGLLQHLTKNITYQNNNTYLGIGDDAAVIQCENSHILISTDMLTEGVHFNLVYTPFKHLGYKAAIINFSDIYAMNGKPSQLTVSIAFSKKFSLNSVETLYEGVRQACTNYNVDIVGGDFTSSMTGLIISMTALGEISEDKIVKRSTAQTNDIICVSGDLGGAYMGVQLLEREREVFEANPHEQPQLDEYAYILERQLKPEGRQDVIEMHQQLEIKPTSMIDVSDGLASDMLQICEASNKGCKLFQEYIPIHQNTKKMAEEFQMEPTMCALNGGEDYELLFTISVDDYEKIKHIPNITAIGHICDNDKGRSLITSSGDVIQLKSRGW